MKEVLWEHLVEKLGRKLDGHETFIFHEIINLIPALLDAETAGVGGDAKIVPCWEPTEHQLLAGVARLKNLSDLLERNPERLVKSLWRVMVAAAPAEPEPEYKRTYLGGGHYLNEPAEPEADYNMSKEECSVMQKALRKSVKVIEPEADVDFDPADVVLDRYEDMSREELIACCHAHDAHHAEHHDKEAALSTPPAQPDDGTLNQLGVISRAFQKGEALITEETPHTTLGDIIDFVSENAADLVNKKVCPSDSRDKDLIAVRDALILLTSTMPEDETHRQTAIAIVNRMIDGGK